MRELDEAGGDALVLIDERLVVQREQDARAERWEALDEHYLLVPVRIVRAFAAFGALRVARERRAHVRIDLRALACVASRWASGLLIGNRHYV